MPRFRVFLQDGSDLPDFVTSEQRWDPGDVVLYNPAMKFRVTAVISPEQFNDFDDEYGGFLEVEPIGR